jgi:hypothetical protein
MHCCVLSMPQSVVQKYKSKTTAASQTIVCTYEQTIPAASLYANTYHLAISSSPRIITELSSWKWEELGEKSMSPGWIYQKSEGQATKGINT